jgi:hypothetical protein
MMVLRSKTTVVPPHSLQEAPGFASATDPVPGSPSDFLDVIYLPAVSQHSSTFRPQNLVFRCLAVLT